MDKLPHSETEILSPGQVEPELYSEPPRMTGKDMAGVSAALVALLLIGYAGYVWLNPDLNWHKLFPGAPPAAETSSQAAAAAPAADMQASGDDEAAALADDAEADYTCAYCGMDASRSQSHANVHWDDATSGHFDSWDCVFAYAKDQGRTLQLAEISQFGSVDTGAPLLDAAQAWYLYDTTGKVEGSMPPYVAAYPDKATAQAAISEMGGEVVDFAGLKDKWK